MVCYVYDIIYLFQNNAFKVPPTHQVWSVEEFCTMAGLVVARALQGVAAAFLGNGVVSLLGDRDVVYEGVCVTCMCADG